MSAQDHTFTRPLTDAGGHTTAGGKGANLSEMLRAGFPVPNGFVVTTDAYERFIADNSLHEHIVTLAASGDTAGIAALFERGTLAPEVAESIRSAYAATDEGQVAVRSSATAEDLPGASFAGQQETLPQRARPGRSDRSRPPLLGVAVDRAGRRLPLPARHGARRHLSIALVVQRLVPLVASITNPAYTPLFSMAAGVVTDIGGVLSHGSIVAREYGIPAVLGTGSATKRIRTGDLLTVDGDRGAVLLPGASPAGGDSAGGRRPWLVLGAGVVAAQRARSKRCQNSLR